MALWRMMLVPRPIGWLTVHCPRRVLIGPSKNDLIVNVVRQTLAALKMSKSSSPTGLKAVPVGLRKLGIIPRSLRVLGAFHGRVSRPPRPLGRRDIDGIIRFVDISLAASKAKKKTLPQVEYTPGEKSAPAINCDFLFTFTNPDIPVWPLLPQLASPRADKKTVPTPITDCCDFPFTFTPSIDHHTEPKFPQAKEAPNVPPTRPSLAPVVVEEEVFAFIEDLSVGSKGVDIDDPDGDDEDNEDSSEDWPSYQQFVRELEGDHWASPVVANSTSGLHATSFRIGQLGGSTQSGAWLTTDWVPSIVKSSLALGAFRSDPPNVIE
ncbi:hypothetical protein FB45DRAFT_1001776 [Roridomyces roridus]|uniref:Uncharacterized protein n=1 Tax=Roridomyces roridus TaxID=1738132 RepID=A0AAD7FSK3_9AGAR|nr:hypothetical protein FB45DRAFT_1001776 [Roridomyces roridus]